MPVETAEVLIDTTFPFAEGAMPGEADVGQSEAPRRHESRGEKLEGATLISRQDERGAPRMRRPSSFMRR